MRSALFLVAVTLAAASKPKSPKKPAAAAPISLSQETFFAQLSALNDDPPHDLLVLFHDTGDEASAATFSTVAAAVAGAPIVFGTYDLDLHGSPEGAHFHELPSVLLLPAGQRDPVEYSWSDDPASFLDGENGHEGHDHDHDHDHEGHDHHHGHNHDSPVLSAVGLQTWLAHATTFKAEVPKPTNLAKWRGREPGLFKAVGEGIAAIEMLLGELRKELAATTAQLKEVQGRLEVCEAGGGGGGGGRKGRAKRATEGDL